MYDYSFIAPGIQSDRSKIILLVIIIIVILLILIGLGYYFFFYKKSSSIARKSCQQDSDCEDKLTCVDNKCQLIDSVETNNSTDQTTDQTKTSNSNVVTPIKNGDLITLQHWTHPQHILGYDPKGFKLSAISHQDFDQSDCVKKINPPCHFWILVRVDPKTGRLDKTIGTIFNDGDLIRLYSLKEVLNNRRLSHMAGGEGLINQCRTDLRYLNLCQPPSSNKCCSNLETCCSHILTKVSKDTPQLSNRDVIYLQSNYDPQLKLSLDPTNSKINMSSSNVQPGHWVVQLVEDTRYTDVGRNAFKLIS